MAAYGVSVIFIVHQSIQGLTGLPVTTTFNVLGDTILEVLDILSGLGTKTARVC